MIESLIYPHILALYFLSDTVQCFSVFFTLSMITILADLDWNRKLSRASNFILQDRLQDSEETVANLDFHNHEASQ